MNIIVDNTFSARDWDIVDFFKNAFDNDYPEYKNVCSLFDNIICKNNIKQKTIIADTPKIDSRVSTIYRRDKGHDLIRISRFCKTIELVNNDSIYISESNNLLVCVLTLYKRNMNNYSCSIKSSNTYTDLQLNTFSIAKNDDISIKGSNIIISIIFFEEKTYPCIPLIKTISDNYVIVSRHNRLHDELPNENWFKFYIELRHGYTSSLVIIVDGTILYAGADVKTHCEISKKRTIREEIRDDCMCCYRASAICIFDKFQVMEKVSCKCIRGGIHIICNGLGEFGSSYVGKYPNHDNIRIAVGAAYDMLTKQDCISGKLATGSCLYGIARR
ncbi:hypothetical protein [Swinepox virus]|uniref:Protein OPG181 n=1 Tax=Swinepox virus TaxID=10276 RepID=A0A881SYE4_SWPV|nr:hypothetical protein [Swinepox virus]